MAERRDTKQLAAIRDAFQTSQRPLSIDEIHQLALPAVPSLGQRTVYRIVRRLEQDHEIAPVTIPGQPDRYELATAAATHHHHFHCTRCDRVFDIDGCPGRIEQLVPEGFILEDHDITLTGLCKACA